MAAEQRLMILVAEDEDVLAEAIEMVIEDLGHHVVRGRDGVHALELLPRVEPDVLLLDLSMPRLDGFGVLAALSGRKDRPPIIVMSAFKDFLPRALEAGAAATLPKPFGPDDLERALARVLSGGEPERSANAASSLPGVDELFAGAEAEELARVQQVACLRIMSADVDEALEELVRAAAQLLGTPTALISIITEKQQWWKAMYGVTGALAAARGTPRHMAFCTHAVAARAPLVVGDAHKHPVFKDNQLVRDGTFDSYAGVPIVIPAVGALGTLCVLDQKPRVFSQVDIEILSLLAARVAAEVEWRERDGQDTRPLGTFQYLTLMDERNCIYNPTALSSFVGVFGRLALAESGQFGVVGFTPVAGRRDAAFDRLIAAVRTAAEPTDVVGWIDGQSVGAVLPRSDQARAERFAATVLSEDERRRAGTDEPGPRWAAVAEGGTVLPTTVLRRLRLRLHPGAVMPSQ